MDEQSLLAAARQIDAPTERAAFLDHACAGDTVLRQRVEQLLWASNQGAEFAHGLRADGQAGGDGSFEPPFAPTVARHSGEILGTRIGPYKLLQKLGEGGMGAVWVAEQEQPVKRRVALKVIKPGMDSAQVLRRFQAERQALALMDHTNIAKVLDAGTSPEGLPYFVMELVKGVPITKYCDELHLSLRERLELFVPVCQAIQHAHQKGIIHRDIKPSNVLVAIQDGKPSPKVIDFGLAKALHQRLTDQSMYTEIGAVVGTLEYMSPEQAELSTLDIDTRTDVYALGVLLYELLTGTTPFDKKRLREAPFTEMLRIIREVEPPKPSTRLSQSKEALASLAARRRTDPARLTREVRGELDWIVMKALEKDRTRRYETANGLARDVERYLHDETVEACPPGVGYQLRKLLRRHKGPALAAVLVFLALLGGIIGTSWGLVRAQWARESEVQQRKLAESERDEKEKARRLADASRAEAIRHRSAAESAEEKAIREAERNRRLLYASDVQLAAQIWQSEQGTARQAEELLQAQIPGPGEEDLREFTWRYQWGQLRRGSTVWPAPKDAVEIAIAADGNVLILDRWGNLQAWNPATASLVRTVRLNDGRVQLGASMARSAGVAAILNERGFVRIVDSQTGAETRLIEVPSRPRWIKLSTNGLSLATISDDKQARIWDVETGEQLQQFKLTNMNVRYVDLSNDASLLLTLNAESRADQNERVVAYEYHSAKPKLFVQAQSSWIVYRAAYSPDRSTVAIADASGLVSLWDSATQKQVAEIPTHSTAHQMEFSADGKQLAIGERDGLIIVWDVAKRQSLCALKGHTSSIVDLAFSSNGKTLVSIANDGTVRSWSIASQDEGKLFKRYAVNIDGLAYSGDGRWLAIATTTGIWIHDLKTVDGRRQLYKKPVGRCAFAPDCRQVAAACADRHVRIWDVETGNLVNDLKRSKFIVESPGPLAISPDGQFVALVFGNVNNFGYDDPDCRFVQLWDLRNNDEQRELRAGSRIMGMDFSPDGSTLATVCLDGSLWLWNMKDYQELAHWQANDARYASVLFCRHGRTLAAGQASAGVIDFWDVETRRLERRVRGHASTVYSLSLSPDGRTLASVSWDKTIVLWDVATGRVLRTWEASNTALYNVAFTPDGNKLTTSGVGGRIKLWEAAPLEEIDRELSQGPR